MQKGPFSILVSYQDALFLLSVVPTGYLKVFIIPNIFIATLIITILCKKITYVLCIFHIVIFIKLLYYAFSIL